MYSCSVNREYQRPETGLPQQFRTGSDSRGEPDHAGTASKLSGTDRGAGSGAVAAGQADNLGEAGQGPAQAASAGIARLEWREFLTDTTLQRLLYRVLHRKYDMTAAYYRVRTNAEIFKHTQIRPEA